MQIATIISLAGTITCAGFFTKQREWLLAVAFYCATAYTVLAQVYRLPFIPGYLVPWLAYLFFVLAAVEFLRKVVLK